MRGADAAFAAARRIWDSAATPQARAYRERLGLAGDGGMAVVVMPLIEARVSASPSPAIRSADAMTRC